MASQIKLVEETGLAPGNGLAAGGMDTAVKGMVATAPATARSEPDPQVVAAIQAIVARLQAVEGAVQGVPKAIGLMRVLLASLGARALVGVALLGCLGLAGAAALHPSWEGLAIFCAFAVLGYLPVAALAYFRGN